MPSLFPGYEYDIFISYRQNDNRSGWVSEFVKNLEEELAATIKEHVSVYFDSNPHDGLLETHHVNKSLDGKLKCLVLIPIISQTYCDETSYAWQKEFCAFNGLAKQDDFGRDIKLGNGNVTCRILPVKIHELDAEDLQALSRELDGPLRPIEFIYKEPGVNRPLRPGDEPSENFNRTKYANQVNKVANAVKAIIKSLKNFNDRDSDLPITESLRGHSEPLPAKSIVVLPFQDISYEKDQEYFCDGLSEELINSLTKVEHIHVVARTSAFSFKGKEHDVRKIGKRLKVESLLEGSVRKAGNHLRISVQLINIADGFPQWSEQYDRELSDIFAIQDEISLAIVENLKIHLLGKERAAMLKRHTIDVEAYNLYLQGRYFWNKWTPDDFRKSITFFEQAVKSDPFYAMAYVSLAEARYHLGVGYWGVRPLEMLPDAIAAVNKAIDIDPGLGEAHAIRGAIKLWHEFDLKGAEIELRRSLILNPKVALAHDYFSHVLLANGAHGEAMEEIEKAIALDPLSNFIIANAGLACYRARKYEKAIAHFLRLQELYPNLPLWSLVGFAYLQNRMFDEAIEAFKQGVTLSGEHSAYLSILGYGYAAAGRESESHMILVELKKRRKSQYLWDVAIAMIYSALGEEENALDLLEKAYEDRAGWIVWLGVEPAFDNISNHPRYVALLNKIGLPSSPGATESRLRSITSQKNDKSIVVLPFTNMSNDAEQEYFCDGITEEIINSLSQIKGLRVIARTSSFAFKGKQANAREIGDTLSVRFLLEGSVKKSGNRLRITTTLIQGEDQSHVWSSKFDRDIADIFLIQDEITSCVREQLNMVLSTGSNALKKHSPSLDAYNYFLFGKFFFNKPSAFGYLKSIQAFEKAIECDPDYALAHAGLAISCWYYRFFGDGPSELSSRMVKHSGIALRLDDQSADGHAALGLSELNIRWNWKGAELEFLKAIELEPSSVIALHQLGLFFSNMGHIPRAMSYLEQALRIDPLNVMLNQTLGWCYYLQNQYNQSVKQLLKVLELDPENMPAQLVLAFAYIDSGDLKSARNLPALSRSRNIFVESVRVWLCCLEGNRAGAEEIVDRVMQENSESPPVFLAWMHIGLKKYDVAFSYLEDALRQKDPMLISIPVFNWWDPIRDDQRFIQVLERMGLSDYLNDLKFRSPQN